MSLIGRIASAIRRPKLTVSIVTRNSQAHLEEIIAQARAYADEVVVGVDADSHDATWQLACRHADTAYRFRHPNQLAAAHLLALKYCQGDWILRLDDDEIMEPGFGSILPELLGNALFTHYYLPRKWVTSENPPQYLHASPWYPDHALRLFRNDPSLVWKPPVYHTGYRVAGPGGHENRYAILHYEPVWCTPERREEKLRSYREHGALTGPEIFYGDTSGEMRPYVQPVLSSFPAPQKQRTFPDIQHLALAQLPPWSCRFDEIDMPAQASRGQHLVITVRLTNVGAMTWMPNYGHWPNLNAAYHLMSADGQMLKLDGHRIPITSCVRPGQSTLLCGTIFAPEEPGDYIFRWDMVNETECWFESCGSLTHDSFIAVIN